MQKSSNFKQSFFDTPWGHLVLAFLLLCFAMIAASFVAEAIGSVLMNRSFDPLLALFRGLALGIAVVILTAVMGLFWGVAKTISARNDKGES